MVPFRVKKMAGSYGNAKIRAFKTVVYKSMCDVRLSLQIRAPFDKVCPNNTSFLVRCY